MNLKKLSYWASVAALGIVLGISLQFVKAWTEPAVAPPGGNIGAPINTGATAQIKSGTLQVNGALIAGSATPAPNPAPNGSYAGNIYANDVYVNSASKWASQLGGSSLPTVGGWYGFCSTNNYVEQGGDCTSTGYPDGCTASGPTVCKVFGGQHYCGCQAGYDAVQVSTTPVSCGALGLYTCVKK